MGPGAIIHAATLKDNCMVGAGAQVLDGAVVESFAIVAPGAVITPKAVVKEKQLWAGSPAKVSFIWFDKTHGRNASCTS